MSLPDDHTSVALVPWPAGAELRRSLAARNRPRLLVVAPSAPAPVSTDRLEDWVRQPADPEEVAARRSNLLRRARRDAADPTVVIDGDGIARRGDGWVALPQVDAALLERLARSAGAVVPREQLASVAATAGAGCQLDQRVRRLRRRIAPLGLRIATVPRRGFLLDVT